MAEVAHAGEDHRQPRFVGGIDDFLVTIELDDKRTRTFRRDGDIPKVEIRDPYQGHRDLLSALTDKNIHDVTAYLVTLK